MAANPVKITDTTLRDGHQSLMATRLRMDDMTPIAAAMDAVGFDAMEVWGGATFDAATRFLGEDPWERLRAFKALIPNTPLSMLLRGQSLVGYRTYANDVVDAFVQQAADVGIDIFRVFDALNDPVNLDRAAQAVKRSGKHLQLTICYSVTEEGRLGGAYYNLDYYLSKAKRLESMGADSICIKDMGGLLAPYDAYELVSALKDSVDVPLQLHCHYTSGMASMSALKAIEAGVDGVDTCIAPLALRTAQPAIEPLLFALRGGERDPALDLDKILEIGDYFEGILPKYRQYLETPRTAVIDARVLNHQIPGGMMSNLVSQLREAGALDRLDEVLAEIPRTRKDLGYPPLVTPMSQMTGAQAVNNVLFGRYAMITGAVREYAAGMYGAPPAAIDSELADKALSDGQARIQGNPADTLAPEMDTARDAVAAITSDIEDALTYALYPATGLNFLRIKHGLDEMPDDMKSEPPESSAEAPQAAPVAAPLPSASARSFNVYVGGDLFEVTVDPIAADGAVSVAPATATAPSRASAAASPAAMQTAAPTQQQPAATDLAANDTLVAAPIPGVVLRYEVEVGQTVAEGDAVVVLEAMKMENTLPAPVSGTVKALLADLGATVAKDAPLAVISA